MFPLMFHFYVIRTNPVPFGPMGLVGSIAFHIRCAGSSMALTFCFVSEHAFDLDSFFPICFFSEKM